MRAARAGRLKKWIDSFGVFAACVTGLAAIVAVVLTHYDSEKQLEKMNGQLVAAQQQVIAARGQLPRSWLYVEFPGHEGDVQVSDDIAPSKRNATRSFTFKIPWTMHNYGQLPATITNVHGTMYLQATTGAFEYTVPFDSHGRIVKDVVAKQMMGDSGIGYVGSTIGPGATFHSAPPMVFYFDQEPTELPSPRGLALQEWISICVDYRDPNGSGRQTCYLGDISALAVGEIADPRFDFQR